MTQSALITLPQLIAAGITPTVARAFLPHLIDTFEQRSINTKRRMAAFIGECSHESSAFTRLEENLYYTDPARIAKMFSALRQIEQAQKFVGRPKEMANIVYANRNGNGSQASGDGWRYRGRGLIQITGRANYLAAQRATDLPFIDQPDLAAQPEGACLTAGWYWETHGLNTLADIWAIDGITKAINGAAMVGRAERAERANRALLALTTA